MRGWESCLVRGDINWPVQGERISASSEQGDDSKEEEEEQTAELCERTECFGELWSAP